MGITKPFKYDRHARRRMKWRNISRNEVEQALNSPDRTELTEKGRLNAFKLIGERYIKVTYRAFPDHTLVISAVEKEKPQ